MSFALSPQDLCGLDSVGALVRAGVHCLKIEGRLKDERYVAATTRVSGSTPKELVRHRPVSPREETLSFEPDRRERRTNERTPLVSTFARSLGEER